MNIILYVSRMVSSQKERDFDKQNFDDMKRVFSIWLCMNMPSNSMSYVHLTKEDILEHYNWNGHLDLLNIVLLGIGRELPPQEEQYELHRLIGTLLSAELTVTQKLAIIETEYHIPLSVELEEGVNDMCNLGEGIEERAIEKTKKEVILEIILTACLVACGSSNKDSVNDDKQEVRLGKMNMPEREVVELLSNGDVELKISKE